MNKCQTEITINHYCNQHFEHGVEIECDFYKPTRKKDVDPLCKYVSCQIEGFDMFETCYCRNEKAQREESHATK